MMVDQTISGKFCPVPFENFEVLWTGDVYLCCSAWVPAPVGNLKSRSVMQIWNSGAASRIRKSVLDGSYSFCSREFCTLLQGGGLPDRDSVTDPDHRDIIRRQLTVLPYGPRKITLDNDRTCNLWCPSCRTSRFVLRGKEFEEAYLLQKKLLGEGLKDARVLHVSGSGDPFASRLHSELLKNIDSRIYPDLKIIIMTNGLLFTPENWNKFQNAHPSVKIVIVSIDAATSPTYRTVRRGGDFGVLLKNLAFISGLRRDEKIDRLEFHFVVQQANYLEMKQFVELGRNFGADLVSFARLCNWGAFSPQEYRSRAVHLPDHPEHRRFLETIRDPAFRDPLANLGNLSEFLEGK